MEEKIENLAKDDKVVESISQLQAFLRYNLEAKKLQEKLTAMKAILTVQRNIRNWNLKRDSAWYQIFGRIRPNLKRSKMREEISTLRTQMAKYEKIMSNEEQHEMEVNQKLLAIEAEKNALLDKLERARTGAATVGVRLSDAKRIKTNLKKNLDEVNGRLTEQEDKNTQIKHNHARIHQESDGMKRKLDGAQSMLEKSNDDKKSKLQQLDQLREDLRRQDEQIGRLQKEKKQTDEMCRDLADSLQTHEGRTWQLGQSRAKFELEIEQIEDRIELERKSRLDREKAKRKVTSELKNVNERLDEMNRLKRQLEDEVKQKESNLHELSTKLDEQEEHNGRLRRQENEILHCIQEYEEELESEQQARQKSERIRRDLQQRLADTSEQLDEEVAATDAQIEVNKKLELQLTKLRQEMEELNINHENAMSAIRVENRKIVGELNDDLEKLRLSRTQVDKEQATLRNQLEGAQILADGEEKQKRDLERSAKMVDAEMEELRKKYEQQQRQLNDLNAAKVRLNTGNAELRRQIDEMEAQIGNLTRIKSQNNGRLIELRNKLDDESRHQQVLDTAAKSLTNDIEQLHEKSTIEMANSAEKRRLLSMKNGDVQQWKSKLESSELVEVSQLEAIKQKHQTQMVQLKDTVDAVEEKTSTLEKCRARLQASLDEAHVDFERHQNTCVHLEKKHANAERSTSNYKQRCDELRREIAAVQKDVRNSSNELFKVKSTNETLTEQIEAMQHDGKAMTQELRDLREQQSSDGRTLLETQKALQRLNDEKDELQKALDDAEDALELEAKKIEHIHIEMAQLKTETGQRFEAKEEEFELVRSNQANALQSMQATLDMELKAKTELAGQKKQYEAKINELEVELDQANRMNTDIQKNIKRSMDQIKELQRELDNEQRLSDELRMNTRSIEKRLVISRTENDELLMSISQVERVRSQQEHELHDVREQIDESTSNKNNQTTINKKLEAEKQLTQMEYEELLKQLKTVEEQSRQASADAARLGEELLHEREHAEHVDRVRRGHQMQLSALKLQHSDALAAARRAAQHALHEAEQRVASQQSNVEHQAARSRDALRENAKRVRHCHELQAKLDEQQRSIAHLNQAIATLHDKQKQYTMQLEQCESLANLNNQKFRKMQLELDRVEERAEIAENCLLRVRSRSKNVDGTPISGNDSADKNLIEKDH